MLALALPFLTRNWKLLAAVALILTGLAWSRHQGAESIRKADRKAEARAVAKAAKVTDQLSTSARKAGDDASASRERIVYRTRTIIQRIPQDVPPSSDPMLGAGWVRNHNASLGLPEDPGLAARAAGEPALHASDALATIDANYAECLKGWDAYQRVVKLYDQTQAAVNGFKP